MKHFLAIGIVMGMALLSLLGCTKHTDKSAGKVLNAALVSDIKGLDPVTSNDLYTHIALVQVYEGLLQYNYLKRPYELEPLLSQAMPVISEDGVTYTFRLRENIFFHDDPAFNGMARPLKASDVVFSFKRVADPHLKSPNWWSFEGRIEGLDEFRKKLLTFKPPIDYDAYHVSGLAAPDDRTIVIKLTRPYRQFPYILTMAHTLIIAPEVVKKYGEEFLNHAVGTGPFVLKDWIRNQKLIFKRNSKYWDATYPTEGEPQDQIQGLLVDSGKKVPFVDEITLWVYVESQPLWLNFLQGNLDFGGIPKEAYDSVFDEKGEIKEEIKRKKIVITKEEDPDIVFFVFNMEDPIVGKNKFLRQAVNCAIDRAEMINLFYNNRAVIANGPIPPGIWGYDPNLKNPYSFDLERAKGLKIKARELYQMSGGKGDIPTILYDITNSTVARQLAEQVSHELTKIGLKIETRVGTWPQFQERMAKKQTQFTSYAWNADYPDPENFLQLLYSKNESPGPNSANFKNKEYDLLYEKMRDMADGPERLEIIRKMVKIIHEEVPWVLMSHRIGYPIRHGWVRNFKRHAVSPGLFKYVDIDPAEKKKILPLLR